MMRRFWGIVFSLLIVLPMVAQEEELCIDGTLLFREDFGGNSPSDPAVSMATVPGMDPSYHNSGDNLGSGNYTLRKEGWHNGIQWHWQDDHTYFGDKTRGYLLEIDGMGGAKPFYSKKINGLCAGSKLTFSAYVVNVHYAGQLDYFGNSYVYPRLKFVLKNPVTGTMLAEKSTGDIQPDWRYGTSETWKYARDNQLSAEWQLIGINFTVPDGIESIQMYIYNDVVENGSGNDFALDDIEIHLCAPPITIEGKSEVCTKTSKSLTANFTNDGTFAEPLAYKWWFSADSLTWTELSETTKVLSLTSLQQTNSGWYKVAVSSADNIGSVNCRAMSEPFHMTVIECGPDLCTDGILLFREDFGGNDPNDPRVSTTPVPGMSYTQATTDVLLSMRSGKYIVTKSGYCNGDTIGWSLPGADQSTYRSQWYIQDDHTYLDDYTRGYFMEIDGNGGDQQFYQTEISGLCEGIELTFSAYVANVFTWFQYDWYTNNRGPVIAPCLKFVLTNPQTGETLAEKNTQEIPFDENLPALTDWQYSSAWHLVGMNFTVPVGVNAISLSIYNSVTNGNGNDFAIDDIEVHLCMTPETVQTDTVVCDTLQQIQWHGRTFDLTGTLRDTLLSSCGFDSIYYELNIALKHCEPPCPDEIMLTYDTLVCDTLLPFTWTIGNQTFIFERVETQQRMIPNPERPTCTDTSYVLRLDTFHCERLYPVIVNKYNWQLLLDNVKLQQFFPSRTALAYQWYKDELPIVGATDDDYSEQSELHGRFQLRLELDGNQTIWSNILVINTEQAEQLPVRVRIYNSHGMPVTEDQVTHGVYLYRYEQGDQVWTEKRFIL